MTAWDSFDRRTATTKTARRLDSSTLTQVNRQLSKLSGRHRAIGRAMGRMEQVLQSHSIGSIGVIAPWDLSTKTGSLNLDLELTHPVVVPIDGVQLKASWEMDGGGYNMRFELS